mgnify:CR=1 FL=1
MPIKTATGDLMMPAVALGTWRGSYGDCADNDYSCVRAKAKASVGDWLDLGGRHIDGANVDGSVILALPTDAPFAGGGLKIWDGGRPPAEHDYAMKPGDCIFLDARVWHQGCPITTGERYALVLFLKLTKTP